jgi:hypothetical protein
MMMVVVVVVGRGRGHAGGGGWSWCWLYWLVVLVVVVVVGRGSGGWSRWWCRGGGGADKGHLATTGQGCLQRCGERVRAHLTMARCHCV